MEKIYHSLDDLLNDCTVRVNTKGGHGTGFFIAPGLILTCAHVIENALKREIQISVYCNYNKETLLTDQVDEADVFSGTYPDLALLRVDIRDHPCVLLGIEFSAFTNFYSYGYTQDLPGGESTTVKCEGTLEYGGTLIKLKDGQVKPGASGSPLLNKTTGLVCGMISNTRDRNSDLGGAGVSTETILSCFPKIRKLNEEYHKHHKVWVQLLEDLKGQKLYKPVFVFEYKQPDEIPQREYFVPRDDLVKNVEMSLEKKPQRVLLNGIAGIGKTTLAHEIAFKYLSQNKRPVLWIEVGTATANTIAESVADYYQDQNLQNFKGDLKVRLLLLRQLIEAKKTSLIILDNFAARETWLELKEALPDDLPVLATSRSRLSIGNFVDVEQLTPPQAFRLLENILQDSSISTDQDAIFLCELFGYHPLALKILGANMKEVLLDAREQRQRLEANPTQLQSEIDQDRLWALVAESASNLTETERETFLTFGHFPHNGITFELLRIYLDTPVDELRKALDRLLVRNLIEKRPHTDFYFLHDVIFHYVKSLSKPMKNKGILIRTALCYLKKNRYEYDLIKLDIVNLLAIAKISKQSNLVQIISYLTIGNYPLQQGKSYVDQRGYSTDLIEQLDSGIEAARHTGDELSSTLHYILGKRGNAAFRRGEYELAAERYEEEFFLSPNEKRRAFIESVYARTLAFCGRVDESRKHFEEAKKLAEKLQDDQLLGDVLGQQSHAAGYLKDYATAMRVAERQLTLAEALYRKDDKHEYDTLIFALLNYGSAKLELARQGQGQAEGVLAIHERAKILAEKYEDDRLLAQALKSLGEYYDCVGERSLAQLNFNQALQIWRMVNMLQEEQDLLMLMKQLGYSVLIPQEEHHEKDN